LGLGSRQRLVHARQRSENLLNLHMENLVQNARTHFQKDIQAPLFLTLQLFSRKLLLTNYMSSDRVDRRLIGLLLLVLLIGAQVHILSDLDSRQTHLCPVCSVLSFAILLALPVLCSLPVLCRAEFRNQVATASLIVCRAISPRAPPSL
jgi:hypothetical protein